MSVSGAKTSWQLGAIRGPAGGRGDREKKRRDERWETRRDEWRARRLPCVLERQTWGEYVFSMLKQGRRLFLWRCLPWYVRFSAC